MSLNAQKTREFFPNVLRRIKLRTRLFVTFLIISLVPVITIGIFSYHAYTRSMNEKVKQAALQSIELLNNNISLSKNPIIKQRNSRPRLQKSKNISQKLASKGVSTPSLQAFSDSWQQI